MPALPVVPAPVEDASPAPENKRRGRGGNRRTKKEEKAGKEVPVEVVVAEATAVVPEPVVVESVAATLEKKPAARSRKPRKPKVAPEGGESA